MTLEQTTLDELSEIAARYPEKRSGLLHAFGLGAHRSMPPRIGSSMAMQAMKSAISPPSAILGRA